VIWDKRIILLLALCTLVAVPVYHILNQIRPLWYFHNRYYTVAADTVIMSLQLHEAFCHTAPSREIVEYFRLFQLEENHGGQWMVETPVTKWTYGSTLFTISRLFTYDVFKIFEFREHSPFFTVTITRVYTVDAWNVNNQILLDVAHDGFHSNIANTSGNHPITVGDWVYFSVGFGFRIRDVSHPTTLQIPEATHRFTWFNQSPSEFQLNFNGYMDRDVAFHAQGDVERIIVEYYADFNGNLETFLIGSHTNRTGVNLK